MGVDVINKAILDMKKQGGSAKGVSVILTILCLILAVFVFVLSFLTGLHLATSI